MRTTRSHAQEETYSSSSEEEEAVDMASESGDSEPNDSTPASSAEKADLQVCGGQTTNCGDAVLGIMTLIVHGGD